MRFKLHASNMPTTSRRSIALVLLFSLVGYFAFIYHSQAINLTTALADDAIPQDAGCIQDGKKRKPSPCSTPGDQVIYVPLAALPEARSSELVFNSRSTKELDVTPTFYKRDGTMVQGEPVRVKSAEIRYVDLKKLLPQQYRADADWGGLSLSYYGRNREMWAQIRFLGVNGGSSVDEFFIVSYEQRATIQEAAWWMPRSSTAILALGNRTDISTSATVQFGDGDTSTINLAPHATEIVRHQRLNDGAESVAIKITGAPGSVIPTGVITSKDGSFNSVIRFYDTSRTKQPDLFANGLRLADVTPHMVLKNTTATTITAAPKFIPKQGITAGQPVELPKVELRPNEAIEVDLTPLAKAVQDREDLEVVSVEVSNSGSPGSLIGSIYGINRRARMSYDVPLRDSGPPRTMTGSYPWKIAQDFTTVVYITNISDQEAEFVTQLNYEGGKFVIDPRKLKPGETMEFDLRQIRDEQMPDNEGRPLPQNVSLGQFKWAVRGNTYGQVALIGRAEMVSRSQHISTSYSCNDPCPPDYILLIDGVEPLFALNQSCYMAAKEYAYYDSGVVSGPYNGSADWSWGGGLGSLSPSTGAGTTMTMTSVGNDWLTAFSREEPSYGYDGLDCYFNNYYYTVGDSAPIQVGNITDVTASGATRVTQTVGNANILHFVTPKGASGTTVTLTATLDPDTPEGRGQVDWEGATENASNPLQATVSKASSTKHVVKVKINNAVVKELRVWVVWSTITSSDVPIAYNEPINVAVGVTGASITGGYTFTHTIAPATIFTDTDRPNLTGANSSSPPGGNHPLSGNPLSGGANKKWDNSRQIRAKTLNPNGLANSSFTQPPPPSNINYPSSTIEGNDDSSTGEETNDPYANSATLAGQDAPIVGVAHSAGANGNTFEWRLHFREFTRLEIAGTWHRISDDYPWRIHLRFVKSAGKWVNDSSTKALNNDGY